MKAHSSHYYCDENNGWWWWWVREEEPELLLQPLSTCMQNLIRTPHGPDLKNHGYDHDHDQDHHSSTFDWRDKTRQLKSTLNFIMWFTFIFCLYVFSGKKAQIFHWSNKLFDFGENERICANSNKSQNLCSISCAIIVLITPAFLLFNFALNRYQHL